MNNTVRVVLFRDLQESQWWIAVYRGLICILLTVEGIVVIQTLCSIICTSSYLLHRRILKQAISIISRNTEETKHHQQTRAYVQQTDCLSLGHWTDCPRI